MTHRLYLSTNENSNVINENVLTRIEGDRLYYNISQEDIDLKGYRCLNVGNSRDEYDLVNIATVNEILSLYEVPIITRENSLIKINEALDLLYYRLQFHKLTLNVTADDISYKPYQELGLRTILPFERGNDYFILNTFIYTMDNYLVNIFDPNIVRSDDEQFSFAINYKNDIPLPDRWKTKFPKNTIGLMFGMLKTATFNPKQFDILKWNNEILIPKFEIQFGRYYRN